MNTGPRAAANVDGSPWAQSAEWAFRFLFFLVAAIAIGWLFSGVHRIAADSQVVVFRFGKAVRQHGAGLLLAWPAPLERVVVLPSSARQIEFAPPRLDAGASRVTSDTDAAQYGFDISGDPRQNTAFLLTGDASVVHLRATIFYQITDPVAYVVAGEHVAPALERLFIASAVATVAGRELDTVLVARPEAAARPAEAAMREKLRLDLVDAVNRRLAALATQHAEFGLRVSRVDISASIPSGAKRAFDHVLTVTQDVQKDIAVARTEAEVKAQDATQLSTRIGTDASARAEEQVGKAEEQTASIAALAKSAGDANHAVLMTRLYNERIGAVFRKVGHVETVDRAGGTHVILPGDTQP
jgi:regulator of protease activity HflC (stomatin/prohibitin superfamily)